MNMSRVGLKIAIVGGLLTGLVGNISAMNVRKINPAYEALRNLPDNVKALFPSVSADGEIRWHHVLGVAADATEEQIRQASRKLQLRVHPDQGGQTAHAGAFQAVQTALNESRGIAPDEQIIENFGTPAQKVLPETTFDAVRDEVIAEHVRQSFAGKDDASREIGEKIFRMMGFYSPCLSFDEYAAHFKNYYSLKGGVYGLAVAAMIGKQLYEKYTKDTKKEPKKDAVKKPQTKK